MRGLPFLVVWRIYENVVMTMKKRNPEEVCLDYVCLNLGVRMLLDSRCRWRWIFVGILFGVVFVARLPSVDLFSLSSLDSVVCIHLRCMYSRALKFANSRG